MQRAWFVWGIAQRLFWAGALVVGAAALASMVAPIETEKNPPRPPSEIGRGGEIPSECETTTIRMRIAEGLPNAHYSLCDDEGNELIRVMYNRAGKVAVTWGDRFSVRAGCWAVPGGSYDWIVRRGATEYRFAARPGGTSGFSVVDHRTNERDGLGTTPDGWIVRGPSIIE